MLVCDRCGVTEKTQKIHPVRVDFSRVGAFPNRRQLGERAFCDTCCQAIGEQIRLIVAHKEPMFHQ